MMDFSDSKHVYNEVYKASDINYGEVGNDVSERFSPQMEILKRLINELNIGEEAPVLEVGCGVGRLHSCHPNWHGIEYSATAVAEAKGLFGDCLEIVEGDARNLPVEAESIDLYFSFAALEHVPKVEEAFLEIERVVRPGGYAILAPAWNCRPWTVKKLEQRPYSELGIRDRFEKFLIPIRNNLIFRLISSLPLRLYREFRLAIGNKDIILEYKALEPDFSLWNRYPHIADDDAFVSIDAHAAITYFLSRGWKIISHPDFMRRFSCRGGEIVLQK